MVIGLQGEDEAGVRVYPRALFICFILSGKQRTYFCEREKEREWGKTADKKKKGLSQAGFVA
jgi:hypothetical protein